VVVSSGAPSADPSVIHHASLPKQAAILYRKYPNYEVIANNKQYEILYIKRNGADIALGK
jgi:hypothetical protein